jgi:hypothetical protein
MQRAAIMAGIVMSSAFLNFTVTGPVFSICKGTQRVAQSFSA